MEMYLSASVNVKKVSIGLVCHIMKYISLIFPVLCILKRIVGTAEKSLDIALMAPKSDV